MSLLATVAAAASLAAAASNSPLHSSGGFARAAGPASPYQMAVDADPDVTGVQAVRNVSGSGPFRVGIDITRVGAEPYALEQWEIAIPNNGLSFDGDVRNRTGATGLIACMRQDPGMPPAGETHVAGACAGQTPGLTSRFVGETTTLALRCLTDGTYPVQLVSASVDPFGAGLFDASLAPLETATIGATITCSDAGIGPAPTNTPPAAAPTPRSDGPTRVALDADPDEPGVQSARDVSDGQPFAVDLDVTSLGAVGYVGYQWKVQFDDSQLALVAGSIAERSQDTDFTLCQHPNVYPGSTVIVESSCARMSLVPSDYLGPTSSFQLRCLSNGTHHIDLIDLAGDPFFGTTLLDRTAANISTATAGITINCSGIGG